MHLRKLFALGLMALLIGGGTAYAALTGVIAGKVTDADGNPIPGVTITVTGANLPGERIDVTSQAGTFRMPELAPGSYDLKAELMGMQTIQQTGIKVSVNSTSTVNFAMEMQKLQETVVVQAEAPVIDVKAATVKTTIEREVTERLPGSDDLFAAFSMSGGITGSGNVRVKGSAQTDNLYLFDGVDTTDPVTSTFGANLNADAIAEVEVQTGAFAAEYGRARGGIVNAVTRSGGNDFHGIIRLKYVNSDWQADSDHPTAEDEYDYWEPTVTFEGPILKDKIWFMLTYQYTNIDLNSQTIGRYGADPNNPDDYVNIDQSRTFHLPYAKITFQPVQSHKIVVNYSGEDAVIKGTSGAAAENLPETYNEQTQGGPFYSIEWTWLYSPSLFFITRAGASFGILDSVPATEDISNYRNGSFYDTYYQQFYNNSDSWSEDERDRTQLSFIANYFVEELGGSHEFKAGAEMHTMTRDNYSARPGGASFIITQVPVGDPNNPDYYTGTDATRNIYFNAGTATESGRYIGAFIQDTWSVLDNLTFNIGLRYETSTFYNDDDESSVPAWQWGQFEASSYLNPDGSHKRYADMKFDDMLAPRFGVNWDVFGNGKTSVSGFWGRFYNPFDLSLPGMFQPFAANNVANRQQEYTGPMWSDRDKDGIPDEDFFFDDNNWVTTEEDEEGDWNLIDPNIEAEYSDEYTVGIEQEILPNFTVNVNYSHRESNDMLEDTGIFVDEDGNIVWTYLGGVKDDFSGLDPNKKFDPRDNGKDYSKHLYYVTNAEGSTREYSGLEINAVARQKNWDLQASYTYSKAEGAVTEAQPGYTGIAQFSGQFDTYGTTYNLYGELPWSARHYFKLAGSVHYDFTDWYELSFGVNAFVRTGYYYSKRSAPPFTYDPDKPDNDINDPSTWTGRPPYRSYPWSFPEGRGGYELPSFYNIDVSLQNAFSFGKWGTATVLFDVENVTDYQGIVSESEVYNPNKPELFGQADGWGTPRVYRLSLKYAF